MFSGRLKLCKFPLDLPSGTEVSLVQRVRFEGTGAHPNSCCIEGLTEEAERQHSLGLLVGITSR